MQQINVIVGLILFGQIFRVPEVIHITCNMGRQDLPDMYTLSPRASGLHIWQIPPAHVTTNTCNSYVNYVSSCSYQSQSMWQLMMTMCCLLFQSMSSNQLFMLERAAEGPWLQ